MKDWNCFFLPNRCCRGGRGCHTHRTCWGTWPGRHVARSGYFSWMWISCPFQDCRTPSRLFSRRRQRSSVKSKFVALLFVFILNTIVVFLYLFPETWLPITIQEKNGGFSATQVSKPRLSLIGRRSVAQPISASHVITIVRQPPPSPFFSFSNAVFGKSSITCIKSPCLL